MGLLFYRVVEINPEYRINHIRFACCGIAGTYGFKKENYKTSQDIGEPLFKQIEALDIDYVVTDCETCKWQIEMSTSKPCEHPISILANTLE